jgi:prevent-host-death family protein
MADDTWTVQDAKAQLSELLRRARAGEPQRIGMTDEACVVVSAKAWEALHPSALGSWLVDNAPAGEELELPPRPSHRTDPFENNSSPTS